MKKVLLIRPDVPEDAPLGKLPPYIPVGLAFLAGVLEKEGFDVTVLDNYLLGKDRNFLVREIRTIKPHIIGVTCNIATMPTTAEIVEIGREENIPTIVGGPQVSVAPEATLKRVGGNIGVVGEGEVTFLELCGILLDGSRLDPERLKKVPGLVVKMNSGDFLVTEKRTPMEDLDVLPFMPLHLFRHTEYARSTPEMRTVPLDWMSTSRGCPFDCAFCSNIYVWGQKYRCMSARRVVDEIEHMMKVYGTRAVEFREDNFTVNRERVIEFCTLLKERALELDWMCESRVELVDEELLQLMRDVGCRAIFFGAESGTQRVLDFLRKGITLEQIENTFRLCRKVGINVVASVMIGIPGQTLEENYETIRFIKKIDADTVYFNPFMGYPGTDTYKYILDKGLVYSRWEDIILPNSEALTWPEKVRFKQKAEILYNLSPRILVGHLKRMGLRRFTRKALNTFSRYMKLWKFNK